MIHGDVLTYLGIGVVHGTPTTQTISPTGISSLEAFGTAVLTIGARIAFVFLSVMRRRGLRVGMS